MKLLSRKKDQFEIAAKKARQFKELEEDGIPVFDTHDPGYPDYNEGGGIWIWIGVLLALIAGLGIFLLFVYGVVKFFEWVVDKFPL